MTGSPATPSSLLPPLGPPPRLKALRWVDEQLPNGLRVIVVRRPNVAMAELRLRIPFQGARATHAAHAEVLAATILAGTETRDRNALAAQMQALGGSLFASADADRLSVGGSTLAGGLTPALDILGDVLAHATYPRAEVARERDRLVERLGMARSQAGVIAREALSHRLWGQHPYTHDMPEPDAVAATAAAAVRRLHAARIVPTSATLVIVGDVFPARVVEQCATHLADWADVGTPAAAIAPLPIPVPGPPLLIDRAGSVQSSLRLAATAVPRSHPDSPALALANLVFGGYFSSRWVENIREDKGYTYSPRSSIEHRTLGSTFVAATDIATDVTAPALLETFYELGRIASVPVGGAELEDARQYAIGTLALSIATQAGLASTISSLAGVGLGPEYLRAQPARLAAVTEQEVSAAATTYLAPSRMVGVIVGDVARIAEPLRVLTTLADA